MQLLVAVSQLLLLLLCSISTAAAACSRWHQLHEHLAEYELVTSQPAASISHCLLLAGEERAVTHISHTNQCRVYRCRLGASGCRKCRNVANSSLDSVWLKSDGLSNDTIGCWRTWQHRVDESVDFYRNWTQYEVGFGQGEDANFWMGLQRIHLLTEVGRRVRWEFSDWNGTWYWAENEFLRVEGPDTKFRAWLGPLDTKASSVGQGDRFMDGMQFSTFDQDNDAKLVNCAEKYQGAWWYNDCHRFNPNGRYFTPPQALQLTGADWADGITYSVSNNYPLAQSYSMCTFECMAWHHVAVQN